MVADILWVAWGGLCCKMHDMANALCDRCHVAVSGFQNSWFANRKGGDAGFEEVALPCSSSRGGVVGSCVESVSSHVLLKEVLICPNRWRLVCRIGEQDPHDPFG